MNTPMIPQDDDIEALLAEDSELLRRYRALPQSEPGKHLDAAILGRASNAVRRPAARQRWLIPIASAASIVAAAGIGWRVHLAQQEERAASMSAPAEKYDVLEIDLQSGDRRRALDTAVMPPQQQQREQAAAAGGAAPLAKSQPTLSEIISGPARDNGVIVDEPHTRADHAEPGRAPEQRQSLSGPLSDDAYATQAAPAAAAAPEPEASKLESVEVTGSRVKRAEIDEEAESDADTLGYTRQRGGEDKEVLAPADWIERMRVLVSARRTQQVREEIERFRAAYPSYRLPPDLRRYER